MKNVIFILFLITLITSVRISENHDRDIITYKLTARNNFKEYGVSLLSLRHTNTTEQTSINIKIAKKLVKFFY
jgi:hypothetical protein